MSNSQYLQTAKTRVSDKEGKIIDATLLHTRLLLNEMLYFTQRISVIDALDQALTFLIQFKIHFNLHRVTTLT